MNDNPAFEHVKLSPELADALEDIRANPQRAETILARLAWRSYQMGRMDGVEELRTVSDLVEEFGVNTQRVHQLARSRAVGWQIGKNTWVFRPEDVKAMRPRPVGRPRSKRTECD